MKNLSMLLTLLTVLTACAANAEPGSERGGRRGPPPEALEACAAQSEGSTCSFSGRNGEELTGSCFAPPQGDGDLACRPDNAPSGGRGDELRN